MVTREIDSTVAQNGVERWSATALADLYEFLMRQLRHPAATLLLVLVLIVAYTSVTRLEGLGRKPYHHDESIHALHSYNLYKGDGWQYDPVYHGPVVYYFNAVGFFLFGDSDYTARVMPAIFGILLVVLTLALGRELGVLESLYAAAFVALSPTLYYFSRFLRDDVYGACWTLMMLLGFLRYQRLRDHRWLYFAVVGIALAFCSKVNALIIGFIFCSSLLVYAAWYWRAGSEPATASERLRRIATEQGLVARSLLLFGGVVLAVAAYVVVLSPDYPARGPGQPLYWAISLGLVAAGLIFLDRLICRWSTERTGLEPAGGFYERHRTLIGLCLVFFAIFGLLYTNFLKLVPLGGGRNVPIGTLLGNAFTSGLHYWYGQQLHPRIADVWYYYVPRLLVYELPLMAVVVLGSFVRLKDSQRAILIIGLLALVAVDTTMGLSTGAVATRLAELGLTVMELALFLGLAAIGVFLGLDDLRRGKPERALLLYWAILSFVIYAKANEKVPWLGVHVVLPLAFYGGALAADLHRHLVEFAGRATRRLAVGLGAFAVAYFVHGGVVLNVHNEGDPREIMVYVQSTTQVLDVVRELEDIAYREGTYHETRITIDDEASWPFSWYLRHYKNVAHLPTIANLDGNTSAVLTSSPPDDQTRALLENNGYEGTRYRLRAWWQPSWELETAEANAGMRGYLQYLGKMAAYVAYRKTYEPDIGSTDFMLYRKAMILPAEADGNGVAKPPEERPRLPENIVPQAMVAVEHIGSAGAAPGQLQQPRGVAVAPDGSLWVVDTGNDRLERYNAKGELLGSHGTSGSGNGQFNKPGGIAIDKDGSVYVADVWNHRIQKFTAEGQFVMTWGKEPDFYGPRDVAVSEDGRVFVSDTGHHKIVCYSATGEYLREWGVKGTRFRQFNEPVGLAIGPGATLYVADTGNRRVQAFDLDGKFLRSFAVAGWEYIYSEPYLALDDAERLWLSDSKNNRVQAYSTNGRFLGALGGPGQLETPMGMATDKSGRLYVSESGSHRVSKLLLESQSIAAP